MANENTPKKYYSDSLFIRKIENIQFVINLCLILMLLGILFVILKL